MSINDLSEPTVIYGSYGDVTRDMSVDLAWECHYADDILNAESEMEVVEKFVSQNLRLDRRSMCQRRKRSSHVKS